METFEYTIQKSLDDQEQNRLSPSASLNRDGLRRKREEREGYRQSFAKDADRILHSRAYTRYIDKTQVFCLISNDHITHRVLHVQLVSRIARTAGRFLFLNEDLIEAIALGHDIGHPPFGHAGESFLSSLCSEHDLPQFQHNIQSLRALDRLEQKGKGWNLTLQTLDGILCHDGEIHSTMLKPEPISSFAELETKVSLKSEEPGTNLKPMTMEACIVRMSDTIAYVGRDIEDAIILGLIKRTDIPAECSKILGNSNGSIVYNLVTDLIRHSKISAPGSTVPSGKDYIGFSDKVSNALRKLKAFNYEAIYMAPDTQKFMPLVKECYQSLFSHYLDHLVRGTTDKLSVDLMSDMGEAYTKKQTPQKRVRDFIAGMTDDYFLKQAQAVGCEIPAKQ